MRRRLATAWAVAVLGSWAALQALACPFCDPQAALTLGEEIRGSEVALLAKIAEDPKPAPKLDDSDLGDGLATPPTKFTIVEVFKGKEQLGEKQEIEIVYFGQQPKGTVCYITSNSKPDEPRTWNTPIPLSDESVAYIRRLTPLPEKGPERLKFYLDYLQNPDDLIAADAYDEFSRADYGDILALKEVIPHDKLVAWITDPDVSPTRRGLYLMLLGACERKEDAQFLKELIVDNKKEVKPRLDATIFCYLKLVGEEGLPLVEERFLANENANYTDTFSAIQALRQLGQQEKVISRPRLLKAMKHLFDRPALVDLVIPDFARWEDWSVADRLVELYLASDEKSSWVRVPIVNYIRSSPKAEAKEQLEKLREFDPVSVKQAMDFYPLIRPAKEAKPNDGVASTEGSQPAAESPAEGEPAASEPEAKDAEPAPAVTDERVHASADVAQAVHVTQRVVEPSQLWTAAAGFGLLCGMAVLLFVFSMVVDRARGAK